MADRVLKGVYLYVFGRSSLLSQNKFLDPSTPSMRKVDDVEKRKKKREKIMTFIVATNVIASRPPERRPTGTPHARANKFLDPSTPSMRKVDDGEKNKKQSTARTTTAGMPHACANKIMLYSFDKKNE